MAGTATNPSEAFPPAIGITFDYPDGWEPLVGAGVHLAVARESVSGEFRPNIVVTVRRVDAAFTLAAAVQQLHGKLATLPEFEERTSEEPPVLGTDGFHIEGDYRHPQAGSLAILTSLAVVSRPNAVDLVEISATCAAVQVESTIGELRDMLVSARTA